MRMTCKMHRRDGQTTDEIYENDDAKKSEIGKEITDSTQGKSSELTGSVKIRSSRAAAVCLGLLCVLLLTAVIVLCVMLTQERQQFISKNENLTNERDQLKSKNENLTNERDQLKLEKTNLQMSFGKMDGWIYYQSSLYFISSEVKNWNESRRDCTKRGADLIIINNREEQDFVKNISNSQLVWIGLTDSDVEDTWKWVDGTNMISGIWRDGEPNGETKENCALSHESGWGDYPCNDNFRRICEKTIFK